MEILVRSIGGRDSLAEHVGERNTIVNNEYSSTRTQNMLNQFGGVYISGCSRNGQASRKCQVRTYGLDEDSFARQTPRVVGCPSRVRLYLSFSSGRRLLGHCSNNDLE